MHIRKIIFGPGKIVQVRIRIRQCNLFQANVFLCENVEEGKKNNLGLCFHCNRLF